MTKLTCYVLTEQAYCTITHIAAELRKADPALSEEESVKRAIRQLLMENKKEKEGE